MIFWCDNVLHLRLLIRERKRVAPDQKGIDLEFSSFLPRPFAALLSLVGAPSLYSAGDEDSGISPTLPLTSGRSELSSRLPVQENMNGGKV